MSPAVESSDCPECGGGVKAKIEPGQDLSFSDLTESDIARGNYFLCPICQIAWDAESRTAHDFPTTSLGPNGLYIKLDAGKDISKTRTSHFRLLGFGEEDELIFRDVGELGFPNDESSGVADFGRLEDQLGPIIQIQGAGYPKSIQTILNALKPGYCVHGTVGESSEGRRLEFDASKSCAIVEAVPVEYAMETDYIPEFADTIWTEDFHHTNSEEIPSARRTYYTTGPAADVYVFPKGVQLEDGIPLMAAMQRGITHHLELFTTNFTGVFTGGVVDVIFISPEARPYFAVYCLGGDCLDLAHELREELGLPVAHQGYTADRTRIFDIRYNPHYVERKKDEEIDLLISVDDEESTIDIENGVASGDAFTSHIEPHEVVVTAANTERYIEVARLRAPSARVGNDSDVDTKRRTLEDNPADPDQRARRRIKDIIDLQPTSNNELAERWGLQSGREAYEYLSTHLDEFYYRDEDSRIRATNRAENLF